VTGRKVDVTQEPQVHALFDDTVKEFGRVDIVVANAAILIAEPIAEADALDGARRQVAARQRAVE